MFYVYQYIRDDSTPYYVGKGKGNRAWARNKNDRIRQPPTDDRIIIVKDNLTENEAHSLEIELIFKYGRKDLGTGILHNLTNGGEGGSGRKNSPEHIAAMAKANIGNTYNLGKKRPKEVVERIAKANTGKKRSEETKRKLSESHLGKKDSEETKLKKSNSAKKPKSVEHAENIRKSKLGEKNPMFGKPSPNRGKKMSDEQKEKIRQSIKKRLAQKAFK
jgi:hypothetical protein